MQNSVIIFGQGVGSPWGRLAAGLGYQGYYWINVEEKGAGMKLQSVLTKLPGVDLLLTQDGYPQPGWVRVPENKPSIYGQRRVFRIKAPTVSAPPAPQPSSFRAPPASIAAPPRMRMPLRPSSPPPPPAAPRVRMPLRPSSPPPPPPNVEEVVVDIPVSVPDISVPEKLPPPAPKYCWATLIMLGDNYVPGVVALSTSLKRVKSQYPLICMVTDDVSERAKKYLQDHGVVVLLVPLMEKQMVPFVTQQQQQVYGPWSRFSITKWSVLNPELFPYEKVMYIDSDMIVVQNMDDLFKLEPPAATFSSPWMQPYTGDDRKGIPNRYRKERELETGDVIDIEDIKISLESYAGSFFGSLALLRPDKNIYLKFLEILNREGPYGHPKAFSGPDEQILSDIIVELKLTPRHIHQADNFIPWKPEWIVDQRTPRALHYCGDKPWLCPRDDYQGGFDRWWETALLSGVTEDDLRSWSSTAEKISSALSSNVSLPLPDISQPSLLPPPPVSLPALPPPISLPTPGVSQPSLLPPPVSIPSRPISVPPVSRVIPPSVRPTSLP